MRMNQQYQQRQNGFSAKQKNHHQQQSTAPKQEFKPIAILKRGDPSGTTTTATTTTVVQKEDNQSKENISANGQQQQQTKSTNYRQVVSQQPTVPIILSSKTPVNASPPIHSSPSNSTSVTSSNLPAPPSSQPTTAPLPTPTANIPSPSLPPVNPRPNGPINLTRTTSTLPTPQLTSTQQEQHIQSINSRLFSSTTTMKSSLKLIDDSLTWCENGQLNNYLQESDGFVVIGAIGREKVGKSTLLSLLGGNQFIDEDRLMIFPAASSNSHKITRGIDVYVTNEQTILLDTQPLLSSQLHQQQLSQASNDYNRSQQQQQQLQSQSSQQISPIPHYWQQQVDPREMFFDNILELQTLEIIAFILAVCHIVLIVEDQFADPYFYRLLQLAEILRPVLKRNSNETLRQHSPHLVFVLNKCNNYISPQERLLIKRSLVQMMMDTHFRIYSSLKQTKKIQIQTNLKNIVEDFKQQELNENLLMKLIEKMKLQDEIDKVTQHFLFF